MIREKAFVPKTSLTTNKRGGVALILILVILAIAGAAVFYLKKDADKTYAADTVQLAVNTSKSISKLNERSSAEDLRLAQKSVDEYLARSDADPQAENGWRQTLQDITTKIAERDARYSELLKQAEEFGLDQSLSELEAFNSEIEAFAQNLNTAEQNRLNTVWSKRKRQVLRDMQSASATVLARSFPSGAKTYLDGEYIGLSSLGINNVRKGKHILAFEKDGYLRFEKEIEVTESGRVEPELATLELAYAPLEILLTGGKQNAKFTISIEKNADDNKDLILYIEEKEGRKVTFDTAPLGTLLVSVTEGTREVARQVIEVSDTQSNRLEIIVK